MNINITPDNAIFIAELTLIVLALLSIQVHPAIEIAIFVLPFLIDYYRRWEVSYEPT